jgi:hypothetical protein
MTIAQTATTSFKVELLQAVHNFGPTSPNTFKVALYTAAANIGPTTTVYSSVNEVPNGNGYTTGGNTLVISVSPTSGNNTSGVPTAFVSFNNSTWTNATFTCRGALVYNSTQGDKSVAVRLWFRQDSQQRHVPNYFPNPRCKQRHRAYFVRI